MSTWGALTIIAICGAITVALRAFPFVVFRGREVPAWVEYLGSVLPIAVMSALVVFMVRHVSPTSVGSVAPTVIALAVTIGVHLWKRNTSLSVIVGTLTYMVCVQAIFV
ncbi:branched-subunit amino acid transport protein AzlD [Arcanobacterium wilhelmae]|uniref:Branched-subunit amino acid transport protein AzlD n=1 Tax=Arcanobacterium wilhelmae TaxID=1803177 RepID=A0ABT9NCX3_9ACTO|nr:AzlD domain-containing protein [Arcanobacterium wilhelmae]MDP9801579.1 branched-subunit amino acid transport protein AzlD [Arcanobacterium wilhelmae]WFN90905.1 AzlD domain-containing protein [Arcanobacterium wilhelmae]